MIIFCITIFICIFVWFILPYSSLNAEFQKEYKRLSQNVILYKSTFSKELLSTKPKLLQKYIRYCGLYDKPMMKSSFTIHNNAAFLLKDDSPMINIQYKQVNFATTCERLAFIDTKMVHVLPFQGLDNNIGGKGQMKGVIAKLFTLFDVKGEEMDISALVTVLAEGVACPSFFMHNDILWEEVDKNHLQATLTQYGMTVSGVFEFNDDGAIISFFTKNRFEEKNGTMIRQDWKAEYGGYKEIDGIYRPSIFKGIWVYPNYKKVYFDCNNVVIHYQY